MRKFPSLTFEAWQKQKAFRAKCYAAQAKEDRRYVIRLYAVIAGVVGLIVAAALKPGCCR